MNVSVARVLMVHARIFRMRTRARVSQNTQPEIVITVSNIIVFLLNEKSYL
jgi:hypothetical protein